jgi:hypothetical protein
MESGQLGRPAWVRSHGDRETRASHEPGAKPLKGKASDGEVRGIWLER